MTSTPRNSSESASLPRYECIPATPQAVPQKRANLLHGVHLDSPRRLSADGALHVLGAHDRIQGAFTLDHDVPELPAAVRPRRPRDDAAPRQDVPGKKPKHAARGRPFEEVGIVGFGPERLDGVSGLRVQHRTHGVARAAAHARIGVDHGPREPARIGFHGDAALRATRRAGPAAATSIAQGGYPSFVSFRIQFDSYLRNGRRADMARFSSPSRTISHSAAPKMAV